MTERSEKGGKNSAVSGAPLSDAEFHKELTAAIPHLRAFARTLCGNRDRADDLAQETLMKAWAARDRYVGGTSFRAWTFTILRHHYFGQLRRERFVGDYDESVAETILNTPGDQESQMEAADVLRALETLPDAQREVLILMAVGSVSYEEIAEICGVAVGTVKSRIARARAALSAVLEGGVLPDFRHNFVLEGEVLEAFITQFRQIAPAHLTMPRAA
ncbi:RNA polymerase sigma-70 factor (ECF subfamily) [Novosphingobium sp. SG751A]|uniref:sigma-70 family RNA polymerase sigma factor n=1 Tax=Novosphingobium sp. SG751A TaxID=2587000 RepID=UPI0015543083|nr:sigma-70 family RNA polymerase sigma factor [Novosphingobium sp. SG751A]NOW46136.1 RNA polymerase sigma-70 factor (ECF subfamily) [Novosphingobium sp. SG751A]